MIFGLKSVTDDNRKQYLSFGIKIRVIEGPGQKMIILFYFVPIFFFSPVFIECISYVFRNRYCNLFKSRCYLINFWLNLKRFIHLTVASSISLNTIREPSHTTSISTLNHKKGKWVILLDFTILVFYHICLR